MRTIIKGQYYVEAGLFVSPELSRYVLRAIKIEPHPKKGAIIVATDGHTMGIWHDQDGECAAPTAIYWDESIARLCEPVCRIDGETTSGVFRTVAVDPDGGVEVADNTSDGAYGGGRLIARFPNQVVGRDGQFPQWRGLIPLVLEEKPARGDYNLSYIERFRNLKDEAGDENSRLTIWTGYEGSSVTHSKDDRPAVVAIPGREDFAALVMPLRSSAGAKYPNDLFRACCEGFVPAAQVITEAEGEAS